MNKVGYRMIISGKQVQSILKTYGKQFNNQVNKPENTKKASKTDNLAISNESKIKHKIMQSLKNSEDVRTDIVKELREQIATGTYTVSDEEVAEKMITRAIVDHIV